jgi:UDP-N-acetylglucosamine 1-carboxyvinyltransferase
MSDLIVHGGTPLSGTITPSGNKNSVLPILCASLLADGPVTLLNVPNITDVEKLAGFFSDQGSGIGWDRAAGRMDIDHAGFDGRRLNGELPAGMRSSVLLFAPLLHRLKKFALPSNAKGCSLGIRELDPHLEILGKLGAKVSRSGGNLKLALKGRFQGARHWPSWPPCSPTASPCSSTPRASPTCRTSAPSSRRWARTSPASAPASSPCAG